MSFHCPSTYLSVVPVASFDDTAEAGVDIFVVVNTNQQTCCVSGKFIQANIGRTNKETCPRVRVICASASSSVIRQRTVQSIVSVRSRVDIKHNTLNQTTNGMAEQTPSCDGRNCSVLLIPASALYKPLITPTARQPVTSVQPSVLTTNDTRRFAFRAAYMKVTVKTKQRATDTLRV